MDKREKVVCNCLQIKRKRIDAILEESDAISFDDLASKLSIGRICGACQGRVKDIIEDFYSSNL